MDCRPEQGYRRARAPLGGPASRGPVALRRSRRLQEPQYPTKAAPGSRRDISWKPQPNPGESLIRLNPNEGIQFDSIIEIVLSLTAGGSHQEYRQKIAVKVFATNGQLKQIVG